MGMLELGFLKMLEWEHLVIKQGHYKVGNHYKSVS